MRAIDNMPYASLLGIRSVLAVAHDLEISSSAMSVLLHLAVQVTDNKMEAWNPVERLASRTKLSERSVQRALGQLQESGLISFVRFRRKGIKVYRITLPDVLADEPDTDKTTDTATDVSTPRTPRAAKAAPNTEYVWNEF